MNIRETILSVENNIHKEERRLRKLKFVTDLERSTIPWVTDTEE